MIKIKPHITTLLLLSLIILTGCQGVDLGMSEEEFKQAVIETNTNIASYAFDTEREIHIESEERDGEREEILYNITKNGSIDRNANSLQIHSREKFFGDGQEATKTQERYVVNDTLYQGSGTNWITVAYSQSSLPEQDTLQLIKELFESGNPTFIGEEEIEGNTHILIQLQPKLSKLKHLALRGHEVDEFVEALAPFAETLQNYEITLWVNKDTYTIKKYTQKLNLVIADSSMLDLHAEINMQTTSTFKDQNEPLHVTIPEAAAQARPPESPTRIRAQRTTFQAPLSNVGMAYANSQDQTIEVSFTNSVGQNIFFTGKGALQWEETNHECNAKEFLRTDSTSLTLGSNPESADTISNGEVFRVIWDCSDTTQPNSGDRLTANPVSFEYGNANTRNIRKHNGRIDATWN